jgi:hypothetical protein
MDLAAGMAVERRDSSQVRIATCRPVTIVTESHKRVVTGDTVDLGPGGMFVSLDDPLPVGERFIFRIDLGEPYKPVLSGGEVRWVDDTLGHAGMGVRFLDIAEVANALGGREIPAKGPETVRVRMEHVGPALEARVVERAETSIVIDLELPFLRPGAPLEVGPDVAARSGWVQSVDWLEQEEGPAYLQLVVDLEPSPVRAAAGQVAASSSRAATEAAAALPQSSRRASRRRTTADLETSAPEPTAIPPTPDIGSAQSEAGEGLAAAVEPEPEPEIFIAPEAEASPATGVAPQPAHRAEPDADTAIAAEGDDGLGFTPSLLDRLVRSVLVLRLIPWLATLRTAIVERARDPRVKAAASRAAALGRAVLARLGPALRGLLERVRSMRLLKPGRKQARGEPSQVVRALTDRTRKVAAGRGKSVAAVLLVVLAAGGLATAAAGLHGSVAETRSLAELRRQAAHQGWSSAVWIEQAD